MSPFDCGGRRSGGLYRLFCMPIRMPIRVPVGLSVALCSSELIKSFECSCNGSDAAHKQDYSSVSNFPSGRGTLSPCDLLPGKTIQMKFMKK